VSFLIEIRRFADNRVERPLADSKFLDRWAYKFVHALLRKLLKKGNLNLQANTPVLDVSDKHSDGWIRVTTARGVVRARAVIHTTNRWASHLRPEFEKLILPEKGTVAAIKAPAGFMKRTGAQHWDSSINVGVTFFHLPGLLC
jgi:glycine/D-amino acid oxidase-like deaminating enzyme